MEIGFANCRAQYFNIRDGNSSGPVPELSRNFNNSSKVCSSNGKMSSWGEFAPGNIENSFGDASGRKCLPAKVSAKRFGLALRVQGPVSIFRAQRRHGACLRRLAQHGAGCRPEFLRSTFHFSNLGTGPIDISFSCAQDCRGVFFSCERLVFSTFSLELFS